MSIKKRKNKEPDDASVHITYCLSEDDISWYSKYQTIYSIETTIFLMGLKVCSTFVLTATF